jgi:enoyl-CoA hydratase
MSKPSFHITARGDVAVATLDRPPANAIDHDLLSAIIAALPDLRAARAVVLTGGGRFFSAGLDLTYVLELDEPTAAAFAESFDDAMTGLFALENPVVAAVNGHAVAGGGIIAASADARIMADGDGQIGLPEIRVGVPFPSSALEIVRAAWGGPHLTMMLERGLTYRPAEALAMNLVNELAPAAETLDRAVALAAELARAPSASFACLKRSLRREGLARIVAARKDGPDAAWDVWRTPEVVGAIRAYQTRVLARK